MKKNTSKESTTLLQQGKKHKHKKKNIFLDEHSKKSEKIPTTFLGREKDKTQIIFEFWFFFEKTKKLNSIFKFEQRYRAKRPRQRRKNSKIFDEI